GQGLPGARLESTPMIFSYGDAVVGSIGNAQRFFIRNAGTATSGAIAFSAFSGTNAGDFTLSGDLCTGKTLLPNSTCTATITFVPPALGPRSGGIQVSATPGGTLMIGLSGNGVTAMPLMIAPTTRTYGAAPNMSTGMPVPFVVTNPNASPSGIITATVSGSNASEFVINGDRCTGHRIGRLSSCTIGVSFDPLTLGTKGATLSVASDAGDD